MSVLSIPCATDNDEDSWDWGWNEDTVAHTPNPTRPYVEMAGPDESEEDDSLQSHPTVNHPDAIEIFPTRVATEAMNSRVNGPNPNHQPTWHTFSDDTQEVEAIPLVSAVPIPNETVTPTLDPDNEVVVIAALVDSNYPKSVITFEEAPAAPWAAVDVRNIPKKGVGWSTGFQRDWKANFLHILLSIVGFRLLVYWVQDSCGRNQAYRSNEPTVFILWWYLAFLLQALLSGYGRALWNMS